MSRLKERLKNILDDDKKTTDRLNYSLSNLREEIPEGKNNLKTAIDNSTNFSSEKGLEDIRNKLQNLKKDIKEKENIHKLENLDFEVSREALTKYRKFNSKNPSNVEINNLINETKNILLNFKNTEKYDKNPISIESIESTGGLSQKEENITISKEFKMLSSLNKSQLRNKNRHDSKSHSTVININSAPQNNKTIINKLTLNVMNPVSPSSQILQEQEKSITKYNPAKNNYIGLSNLDSEREELRNNYMKSATGSKISLGKDNTFLFDKSNYSSVNSSKNKLITNTQRILVDFKRNKDSYKPVKPIDIRQDRINTPKDEYNSNLSYKKDKSFEIFSRNELRKSLNIKSLNISQGSQKSLDRVEESTEPKTNHNKIKKEINSFLQQLEKEKVFKNFREKIISNNSCPIKICFNRNFNNSGIDYVYGEKSKNSDHKSQIEIPIRQSFDIMNSIDKFYSPQYIKPKIIKERIYNKREEQNTIEYYSNQIENTFKLGNYLRINRNNDATRNLLKEDEEERGKHILTFSKPLETQTGKNSFRNDEMELLIKLEEIKILKKQISSLKSEDMKKMNDDYITELKDLANSINKTFE